MKKVFIAIDNGVSGSIARIEEGEVFFDKVPTVVQQDYTKKKSNITRIDFSAFKKMLSDMVSGYPLHSIIVGVERPMVNPKRFVATASALRAWEATLIILEELELPYIVIDSKKWQKHLLPQGSKGAELKEHSLQVGNRLFPQFKEHKHKDRDGLLIAEYLRQTY